MLTPLISISVTRCILPSKYDHTFSYPLLFMIRSIFWAMFCPVLINHMHHYDCLTSIHPLKKYTPLAFCLLIGAEYQIYTGIGAVHSWTAKWLLFSFHELPLHTYPCLPFRAILRNSWQKYIWSFLMVLIFSAPCLNIDFLGKRPSLCCLTCRLVLISN